MIIDTEYVRIDRDMHVKTAASSLFLRDGNKRCLQPRTIQDSGVQLEDRVSQLYDRGLHRRIGTSKPSFVPGPGLVEILLRRQEGLEGVIVKLLGECTSGALFCVKRLGHEASATRRQLLELLRAFSRIQEEPHDVGEHEHHDNEEDRGCNAYSSVRLGDGYQENHVRGKERNKPSI
jgi:hypothetical protein